MALQALLHSLGVGDQMVSTGGWWQNWRRRFDVTGTLPLRELSNER